MKKIIAALLLVSILLTGCDLWMDGSYHNVEPHLQEHQNPSRDQIWVSDYTEMCQAVSDFIEDGASKGVIYLEESIQNSADNLVQRAVSYAQNIDPIGNYALESITYDIGTSHGLSAVAMDFRYRHGRSEILQIKRAADMEDAQSIIASALDNYNASVVICVEDYWDQDFIQFVQDYVDATPWSCMEMPQVSEMVYPAYGSRRIIELGFTYQNSREALRVMQENVEPVFSSAELYVRGDGPDAKKYSQLYSFLMERYDYVVETSVTPSYSLLCHGVGDARAFALVYSAMCKRAELPCYVVSGTKAGEPWHWNLICVEDSWYHVDLLQSSISGGFTPMQETQMSGYVWDYSAYPRQEEPEASEAPEESQS